MQTTADRSNPYLETAEDSWRDACHGDLVPETAPDKEAVDIAIGGHVDDDPAERSPDHAA